MSTCNRLNLQTLGSQPVMPKNLPDHCSKRVDFGVLRTLLTSWQGTGRAGCVRLASPVVLSKVAETDSYDL